MSGPAINNPAPRAPHFATKSSDEIVDEVRRAIDTMTRTDADMAGAVDHEMVKLLAALDDHPRSLEFEEIRLKLEGVRLHVFKICGVLK